MEGVGWGGQPRGVPLTGRGGGGEFRGVACACAWLCSGGLGVTVEPPSQTALFQRVWFLVSGRGCGTVTPFVSWTETPAQSSAPGNSAWSLESQKALLTCLRPPFLLLLPWAVKTDGFLQCVLKAHAWTK